MRGEGNSKSQVPLRNCLCVALNQDVALPLEHPVNFPPPLTLPPTHQGCVCTSKGYQRATLKHKTWQSHSKPDLWEQSPLVIYKTSPNAVGSCCTQEKLLLWKSPTPALFDVHSFPHSPCHTHRDTSEHCRTEPRPCTAPLQPAVNRNLSTSCQVRDGFSRESLGVPFPPAPDQT